MAALSALAVQAAVLLRGARAAAMDAPALPPLPPPTSTSPTTSSPVSTPTSTSTLPEPSFEPAEPLPPPPRREPFARWSAGVNPLAFLLGRFGGDVEYLAFKNIAFVGNLHFDASGILTSSTDNAYVGFGGEAGVRFYPASSSIFGFFFGPSLVAGWYSVNYYGYGYRVPDVGFALDAGGKARVGSSMFIAGGGGLQRLYTGPYPKDVVPAVTLVLGPSWAPRILFTFGWTFR